ncbi:MAG: YppG family protein [Bacilli bacterium]
MRNFSVFPTGQRSSAHYAINPYEQSMIQPLSVDVLSMQQSTSQHPYPPTAVPFQQTEHLAFSQPQSQPQPQPQPQPFQQAQTLHSPQTFQPFSTQHQTVDQQMYAAVHPLYQQQSQVPYSPYPLGTKKRPPIKTANGWSGVLNQFKAKDGSYDVNKVLNTTGTMVNTFNQIGGIVKQVGGIFKFTP